MWETIAATLQDKYAHFGDPAKLASLAPYSTSLEPGA